VTILRLRSRDGTEIACARTGNGPPLALVHGSGADRRRWAPVAPLLAAHFTLLALDRRGHGDSGDAAAYGVEREVEDIAALVGAVGEGALPVVGHSFGALCALGAACEAGIVSRLVLYEPPLPARPGGYFGPELIPAMRGALQRGDADAAVEAFARAVFAASPPALAAMRRSDDWSKLCAAAGTTLRELEAVEALGRDPRRLAATVPTLLLLGGESGPPYRETADLLLGLMPAARLAVLPGQGHGAIDQAPRAFASAALAFLTAATLN
jgi:pimeloyl-ACP methyl ester carboxylesterase